MDRDGRLDLVAGESNAVLVLPGDGDGGFGAPRRHPFPPSEAWVQALAVDDLDGDGCQDVVASTLWSGGLYVLLGDGGGGFRAVLALAAQGSPGPARLVDFDRDGRLDLLVPGRAGVQIMRNLSR